MTRAHLGRVGWLAGCACIVAVAAVAWWAGASSQSPEQAAARAVEPAPSWITAEVEWRTLQVTVIQRGEVVPEFSTGIGLPVSIEGDPIVTQISTSVADQVIEGDRVLEVSGRPVFVMQGAVPVYRSLRPGMSGDDVAQLQAALARLGYAADTDGVFGELTKTAVREYYADAGYESVPSSTTSGADIAGALDAVGDAEAAVATAELALSRAREGQPASVVAAAESAYNQAIREREAAVVRRDRDLEAARQQAAAAAAERDALVAAADATEAERNAAVAAADEAANRLAEVDFSTGAAVAAAVETLRVAGLALEEARTAADVRAAELALANAVKARDRAALAYDSLVATNGPTVAQGEVVFVPSLPARVLSVVDALGPIESADRGDATAAIVALVVIATGPLVVSTSVRERDIGLVRVGMAVELLDEGSGRGFPGRVARVDDQPVEIDDGRAGYPAVVETDVALPDSFNGRDVRVTITSAATADEVMVVPLAAVSASTDGTERVSVVSDPNANPVDVAVVAGITADGLVAVTPVERGALDPGDLVVLGR